VTRNCNIHRTSSISQSAFYPPPSFILSKVVPLFVFALCVVFLFFLCRLSVSASLILLLLQLAFLWWRRQWSFWLKRLLAKQKNENAVLTLWYLVPSNLRFSHFHFECAPVFAPELLFSLLLLSLRSIDWLLCLPPRPLVIPSFSSPSLQYHDLYCYIGSDSVAASRALSPVLIVSSRCPFLFLLLTSPPSVATRSTAAANSGGCCCSRLSFQTCHWFHSHFCLWLALLWLSTKSEFYL